MKTRTLLILGAMCAFGPLAQAATDRIIVKWRADGVAAVRLPGIAQRAQRLQRSAGESLRAVRTMRLGTDVYRLRHPLGASAMRELLNRLNADPSVQYAEADERRYIEAVPNDPRFVAGTDGNGKWRGQWYLGAPTTDAPAAIDAVTAWDYSSATSATTTGAGVTVAVVDTGIRPEHPDLAAKLLPGFDFVCNDDPNTSCLSTTATQFLVANDGDSWDNDPSDPGDWIDANDLARTDGFFNGCGSGASGNLPEPSSWHGTRVAGIVGAITNNGIGGAGVAPDVRILPVRVLGKCGGYTSDIVDGMLWAAGLTTTNGDLSQVTGNPSANRAQIINLSLGADAACSQTEQDAVGALVSNGVVVIASAGNSGGPVGAPANCAGVISVSGLRHVGTKVGYSNVSGLGSAITIGAPAGNCVNIDPGTECLYSIETTSNDGTTAPGNSFYTYSLFNSGYAGNPNNAPNVGTSFSAPIVSGVAALMVQVNPNMTVDELSRRLQATARPFPTPATPATGGVCHVSTGSNDLQGDDCQCTTATCGAGMLDARAAVADAEAPIPRFTTSTTSATVGQTVDLDGSASSAAPSHHIVTYQWSASPSVDIANANQPQASFVFPAFRNITVSLKVTDEAAHSETTSVVVTTPAMPKSGGGEFGIELFGLAALAALRRRRNNQPTLN